MANGKLTEEVIEQVAEHLEETAEVTRRINANAIGLVVGGMVVGIGIGFVIGYRFNREKIRAEAFAKSEEELEKIREAYDVRKNVAPVKEKLEEIIEEKGYATRDETEEIDIDLSQRPLKAPVPIDPTKKVFRTEEAEKDKDHGWSYPRELRKRTAEEPFIIHQDEFALNETDYSQTTYTYYEGDGVLTDTDDSVLRIDTVGESNLKRFGHGSDDFNVLFVRNPKLELDIEICRSNKSYEEEVTGLEHSDTFERMPRHGPRFNEDDEN